jgi:hypothetical protein
MDTEPDVAAWARAHRACFEVGPLVEMKGKEKLQVGFTLDLYAAFPTDKPDGAERLEEASRIWQRLKAIVDSLAPQEGEVARVDVEPQRTAAFLRPANDMAPEVGLQARIFHKGDYFAQVTGEERTRLSAVEKRLTAMGVRSGHW